MIEGFEPIEDWEAWRDAVLGNFKAPTVVIKKLAIDPAVKPKTIWQQIYSSFISDERQAMRKALRNWCVKGGCVMAVAAAPRFPWVEEMYWFEEYLPDETKLETT